MGKKYNIELAFTANASQVKRELDTLKTQLSSISNINNLDFAKGGMSKEILEASNAAIKLRTILEEATHVNTGQLNLKSFTKSLKESGMTLQDYKRQLEAIGPQGAEAFNSLANSIISANANIKTSNSLIDKLGKSFKNVLTWKISTAALDMMTSSLYNAVGYARDLNKSLTDIGIVSNKNTASLAEFAKTANKAAKQLSTTTKDYANASLIYFQQGLSDSEVKERTDLTIKMANVTGEAAADVSSYMTAIWNNFDDGLAPLSKYADIITALGAATASSSEEIAGGLEKFAAIADTIGLSYEYATSALATVVAATRQSEDTVGTAFKTIFGRFQSLQLGETLDDGTSLTKYTKALATVGIDIKDSNDQLKEMDQIVDELGERWKTLSRDEQVALANTIAGTRQYANLISLLDNYENFQANLEIAKDAEGTLESQAYIYEKSWEAASKRVKTSLEDIYDDLINEDAMIEMMDFLSDFIDKINVILKSVGGIPGILSVISTLMMKTFSPKIVSGMVTATKWVSTTAQHPIKRFKGEIMPEEEALRKEALTLSLQQEATVSKTQQEISIYGNDKETTSGLQRIGALQEKIYSNAKKLSDEDSKQLALILDRQRALEKEYEKEYDLYVLAQKTNKESSIGLKDATTSTQNDIKKEAQKSVKDKISSLKDITNTKDRQSLYTEIKNELINYINSLNQKQDMEDEEASRIIEKIKNEKSSKGVQREAFYSEIANELFTKKNNFQFSQDVFKDKELNQPLKIDEALANASANIEEQAYKNETISSIATELTSFQEIVKGTNSTLSQGLKNNESFIASLKKLEEVTGKDYLEDYKDALENVENGTENAEKKLEDFLATIETDMEDALRVGTDALNDMEKQVNEYGTTVGNVEDAQTFFDSAQKKGQQKAKKEASSKRAEIGAKDGDGKVDEIITKAPKMNEVLSNVMTTAMSLTTVWSTLSSLPSIFSDEDLSAGDKFMALMTSITSLIPTVTSLISGMQQAHTISTLAKNSEKAATLGLTGATHALAVAVNILNIAMIAITAVVAVVALVMGNAKKKAEEYEKQLENNTETAKKNLEVSQEQADTLKELTDRYDELNKQLQKDTDSAEEFYKVYKQLNEELSKDAGENVLGSYTLEQLIDDEGLREELLNNARKEAAAASANAYNDAKKSYDEEFKLFKHNIGTGELMKRGGAIQDADDAVSRQMLQNEDIKRLFDQVGGTETANIELRLKDNLTVDQYEKGIKALEQLLLSDDFRKNVGEKGLASERYIYAMELVQNSKTGLDNLNTTQDLIDQNLLNKIIYDTEGYKANNLQDYLEWFKRAKNQAVAEGKTETEFKELLRNSSDFSQFETLIQTFTDNLVGQGKPFDTIEKAVEKYSSLITNEQRQAFRGLTSQEVEEAGGNIEKALAIQMGKNLDASISTWLEDNKISQVIFDTYIERLKDSENVTKQSSLALKENALYVINLSQSLDNLIKGWEEYSVTLLEGNKNTYKFLDAVEKLQPLIKQAFGFELSFDLFDNDEFIKYFNQFLEGSIKTDDLQTLFSFMGNDIVNQSNTLSADNKTMLQEYFTKGGIGIGSNLQNQLNEFLKIEGNAELFQDFAKAYGYYYDTQKNQIQKLDFSEIIQQQREQYDEAKRLNVLNAEARQIEYLTEKYDKLEKSKSNAYGKDKLNIIQQQKQLLENENSLLDTQIEKYKTGMTSKQQILDQQAEDKGIKVLYDEETGTILNEAELLDKGVSSSVIEEYTDYQAEILKRIIEKSNNEDLLKELGLEEIEITIDYKAQMSDTAIENIEYAISLTDSYQEKILLTADKFKVLEQEAQTAFENINDITNKYGVDFNELAGMDLSSIDALNMSELDVKSIETYIGDLRSVMNDLTAVRKEQSEYLLNYFEESLEKVENGIDKISVMKDFINTYQNIIEIVGQDVLGVSNETLKRLDEKSLLMSKNLLDGSKENYEQLLKIQQETQKQLETAKIPGSGASEETIAEWQKTYDEVSEKLDDAKKDWLNNWQEALQSVGKMFNDAVKIALDEMETALTGSFGNLSYLQEAYDQQITLSEQYLEDYEKTYELSKLMRNLTNSINDTKNIKGKQQLKELQDEIVDLQKDGVNVSKYDLEILQKRYDLQLAEMALQDAKDAKTQVRLQRGSDGSLSYIYTANQQDIDKAQQEYENKMYDLQKINREYLGNIQNDLLSLIQDYMSQMQELASDTTIGPEEKLKQSAQLLDYLTQRASFFGETFNKALQETGLSFEDTTLGQMLSEFDSFDEFIQVLNTNATNMNESFVNDLAGYQDAVNAINQMAGLEQGQTMDSFLDEEGTNIALSANEELEKTKDIGKELSNVYGELTNNLSQFYGELDKVVKKLNNEASSALRIYERLLSAITGVSQIPGWELTFKPMIENPNEYDTGGYTGSWGSSGKLAVLHEKELILNQADTSNILRAVDIARQLQQNNNIPIFNSVMTGSNYMGETRGELQQNVTITADFPNVTNHLEIEEAFENIINLASQYANRK